MEFEHRFSKDSKNEFVTSNYGVTTCSWKEWAFVVQADRKDVDWPMEEKLRDTPERMRKPLQLEKLHEALQLKNMELAALCEPLLLLQEAYAARLYTGPMFVKCAALTPHRHVMLLLLIVRRTCVSSSDCHLPA